MPTNNIVIKDANDVTRTVATVDDGTEHLQRTLANLIAIAAGGDPVTVAAAAYSGPLCDTHGFPYVNTGHPNLKTYRARSSAAISNSAVLTPTSGRKLKFVGCQIATKNGNDADVDIQVGFGASSNDASLYSHPGIAGNTEAGIWGVNKTGATNESIRVTTALTSGAATYDYLIAYVEVPT